MNRRRFYFGVLFVCTLLAGCVSPSSALNVEPRYKDKSLSEWITIREKPRWSPGGDPESWEALAAIQHIGTNARPWLRKWIRSDDPVLSRHAVTGFLFLREEAVRAIPELTRQMNQWRSLTRATNAALVLGCLKEALPSLVPVATNQASPDVLRLQVVQSIATMGSLNRMVTNVHMVTPALIRCLQDKDWQVAAAAASGLYAYTTEPRLAVPALVACLLSRTNPSVRSTRDDDPYRWHGDISVRCNVVDALGGFGEVLQRRPPMEQTALHEYRETVRSAVPALVKALDDEDWRVAFRAATALGEARIEPQLAVPALIKSLNHPDPHVRCDAAEALGEFGEAAREAIPALTKALDDAYPGAADDAERALSQITRQTK